LDHLHQAYNNATFVAGVESNGGLDDVRVVSVWAMDETGFDKGSWGFFAFCKAPPFTNGTGQRAPTTSMVGAPDCNQTSSADSTDPAATGDGVFEISASASYMATQGALPFGSAGHLRGLTMQRLFKKVLQEQPKFLFMSSFNEFIGGRQQSVFKVRAQYYACSR
jgi:hypothetical protein